MIDKFAGQEPLKKAIYEYVIERVSFIIMFGKRAAIPKQTARLMEE